MMSKIILVLALALATLATSAHAEFKWQHFGADPYATTRAEAMQTRESAFRMMGLPAPVVALLMEATKKPGERTRLVVGDRLSMMLSKGGVVHRNVIVAFVKPPVSGKMEYAAPAEKWQVSWQGKVYTIFLPEVCYNWSLGLSTLASDTDTLSCYKIPLDYRQTPGVMWNERHAARIEFHLDGLSGAELERLARDPCFKVIDETGVYVPYRRCEACGSSGGEWPPAELAKVVGLPEKEPQGVFTAPIASGVGIVSLPHWATIYLGIYCVDVEGYPVSIQGYGGWTAVTRFDLVTSEEMQRTLPKGKLDRVFSGAKHY